MAEVCALALGGDTSPEDGKDTDTAPPVKDTDLAALAVPEIASHVDEALASLGADDCDLWEMVDALDEAIHTVSPSGSSPASAPSVGTTPAAVKKWRDAFTASCVAWRAS